LFYALLNLTGPTASILTQPEYQGGLGTRHGVTIADYSSVSPPKFVLADPSIASYSTESNASCGCTFQQIADTDLTSGAYGLLGEASGMILLEHNYTGPVQYYVPLVQSFGPSSFFNPDTGLPFSGQSINSTNTSGGVALWVGPYSFLSPGLYNVTFQFETTNLSTSNSALIQLLAGPTASIILTQFSVYGSNFTRSGEWTRVTTTVYVNSIYERVQYIARSYGWTGTLSFRSVDLVQRSP
jgi:hypothetical protein